MSVRQPHRDSAGPDTATSPLGVQRWRVRVSGIVQGVGFRPFVHTLARELGLTGFVGNDESGVVIEAEGCGATLDALLVALRERPPALALVTGVSATGIAVCGDSTFAIAASASNGRRATLISPDTATCADCLAELRDPADRRYRHPFVNCTNCGPRFTIVTDVPYDRAVTTMAGFPMCAACAAEYHDPSDRRFHAQPVCCPDCGPTLRFTAAGREVGTAAGREVGTAAGREVGTAAGREVGTAAGRVIDTAAGPDPITAAAAALRAGAVVAIKGLGGYHLAVLATDETAVAALRARKHREDKPFAVLAPDLAAVRALCVTGPVEEAELTARRAPIVLLRRRPVDGVAPSVAPGNAHLGLLLPYTPIHHLLLDDLRAPIVLTSGNVSDEPIAHLDDDAAVRLAGIADAYLTHDRPIRTRADDSVLRVVRGRTYPIRRSRGYTPEPLRLMLSASQPVLGCGAELKNTFCLLRGADAFCSHHIGDLENAQTLRAYTDGIAHLGRLLDVDPVLLAHDLHPEYLSTKFALGVAERDERVELVGVQHHHAHLAACLAEHGETGPVVGIACDGLGYGTDGVLWGGEVMEVSLTGFRRLAYLEPVALPGGTTAIRQPWRTAVSWLRAAGVDASGLDVARRNSAQWGAVQRLLSSGVGVPITTSAGRLFDAVAALIGVRDRVNYEGQAAIELEQAADASVCGGYPAGRDGELIRGSDLVRGVVADLVSTVDIRVISARFHNGLAAVLVAAAADACADLGHDTVALSGGVFQNLLLLERVTAGLEGAGLRVLAHSRVPCNDGGISLGQVAVAGAITGTG
ncbi:carbamoyltransferase HypF [Pseudonocardia acidicola]|uniref:Carbamoyltransferase n=1 Tax=Pseudonocardia acidicola TaxID=2724939 RepID=A0ABX1S815_9PSEU|nr:carbamoyltransferase HypF [Pseudonocardia acidicola]NMH97215.1 carbamoyltransferase HypF [Pseudonocardia acidicola]